jgi:hypothetical protein
MHRHPRMNEQKLIDALVARARDDARDFRAQYPDETPTDLWIENSYTAALPLAKDAVQFDPGPGPHPPLFTAYRREIDRLLGEREHREKRA